MRTSDRVLVQRQGHEILPVLADTCADVIVAPLHANTLFAKQLCNCLAYSASMTTLATEDIRISKHWIKLMVLNAISRADCCDMLGGICNCKFSNAKSVKQDDVCVVIYKE